MGKKKNQKLYQEDISNEINTFRKTKGINTNYQNDDYVDEATQLQQQQEEDQNNIDFWWDQEMIRLRNELSCYMEKLGLPPLKNTSKSILQFQELFTVR